MEGWWMTDTKPFPTGQYGVILDAGSSVCGVDGTPTETPPLILSRVHVSMFTDGSRTPKHESKPIHSS